MRLSVVIVSWNTVALLRRCLETLRAEVADFLADGNCQVFVVDNASHDGSAAMVASEHPWVKLIANDSNAGFARGNNQAIKQSLGDNILLLNPDTEVLPSAIHTLLKFLDATPQAGVVAPQLLNSDLSIQRSCRQFPTFAGMFYELVGLSRIFAHASTFRQYKMLDWQHDDTRQVDQPEGACLMIRRAVIDKVGLLDEGYFMLFEEVDWCYRIKEHGYQIWFTPEAKVIHHYGQSIKQVKAKMILSSHRGMYRFWHKHYQGKRWYLSAPAYMGLMSLAYVRIAAHSLRQAMGALETPSASSVQLDNDKKVVEEKVEVGNRKL
jgi:GT2 family glycosyltransferase